MLIELQYCRLVENQQNLSESSGQKEILVQVLERFYDDSGQGLFTTNSENMVCRYNINYITNHHQRHYSL